MLDLMLSKLLARKIRETERMHNVSDKPAVSDVAFCKVAGGKHVVKGVPDGD